MSQTTYETASTFLDLVRQGKNLEAISEFFAEDIQSIEAAQGTKDMPQKMQGIEAVRQKNQWWIDQHEVHRLDIKGPFPNQQQFAATYNYDVTNKQKNQRFQMEEVALYTLNDQGKIIKEEYFYTTG